MSVIDRILDDGWLFFIAPIGGAAFLFAIVIWVVNAAAMPGALAEIEQIRADAAVVDPLQAEDVIGQVTQWNQTIRSNQAFNDTWWAGWAIPDEWDGVELIPVPK